MIPRNFVESYWKDVSNPISLKLPNGSDCKMYWVQQEANRNREGRDEKAKKCTKTKDANERRSTNTHPHENPNFTLKLSRSNVEGDVLLNIPIQFSKEYKNELLQGNAAIRSAGEERTWHVTLTRDNYEGKFRITGGWKSFSQEHNLHVGDVCKFEMTQREPLSFTITITPSTKEPCPEQFQDSETPILHNKFKVSVTSLFMLVIPSEFLKRHNISSGISVELKVGEGTWFVEVSFKQHLDYGWFTKGWPEFARECKVKIGDTLLFETMDLQNHVFKVSITLDV
ncbi:hypothetical protein P8452_06911 [Trifolium repens]|nr:hypothetical protein P8452_06911 [Trifolium repens]